MLHRARAVLPILLAACSSTSPPAEPPVAPQGPQPPHLVAVAAVPLTQASVERLAYRQTRSAEAAPFQLTASDGTGLQLARIDAKAILEGPLAFTELHLYFHNDQGRTREGTFQITLPEGAAVSRFAMETDGQMQEAEVVDKQVARRAYDDALHRRQDPALLEKSAGNQFTAKVFPIAGNADKHLVISFSQELPGTPYVLPLRGLPTVSRVDVSLTALGGDGSRQTQRLQQQAWKPDRDFVSTAQTAVGAIAAGQLIAAQVAVPPAEGAPAVDAPRAVTVLVDTSASRALGFARYTGDVRALVGALAKTHGGGLPIHVVAFDQDAETIYSGRADGYGDAQDGALRARGAAGASDLGQALAYLGAHAIGDDRIVVVGDGVLTAGPTGGELSAQVAKLHAQRLDVVLAGGIRDEAAATALVRAGLPHAGTVLDLDADGAASIAHQLDDTVRIDVPVQVAGATWVYPRVLPTARAGERVMVYARLGAPTAQAVHVSVGGAAQDLAAAAVEPALLERSAAGAHIRELEAQREATTDHTAAAALAKEIGELSVAARVISSQTAMIVLESDDDYARYGIQRSALASILVVGPNGVERTSRQSWIGPTPQLAARGAAPGARAGGNYKTRKEAEKTDQLEDDAKRIGDPNGDANGDLDHDGIADTPDASGADDDDAKPSAGEGAADHDRMAPAAAPPPAMAAPAHIPVAAPRTMHEDGAAGGNAATRTAAATATAAAASFGDVEVGTAKTLSLSIGAAGAGATRVLSVTPAVAGITVGNAITRTASGPAISVTCRPTAEGAMSTALRIETDAAGHPAVTVTVSCRGIRTRHGSVLPRLGSPFPLALAAGPILADETQIAAAAAASAPRDPWPPASSPTALDGPLAQIEAALGRGDTRTALAQASAWHERDPGDVLALIGLGDALEATHDAPRAARIYGSIIDLFPARADMRRFAGERLARLGDPYRWLAIDSYQHAVADRPDHITGHRLLAYALLRDHRDADAFAAILAGVDTPIRPGRYAGADRVLAEDAGMIAASYLAHDPSPKAQATVTAELAKRHLSLATQPSTRFILYWETDANDVDFHIQDARGGHAYYASPALPSGGALYADITTGYGPECFTIPGKPAAGPYRLSINYFSQGPMGYGMGLLEVQRFDGKGGLRFEDRPYVIMHSQAYVDLGAFE